jgi:hypothetical protein
MPRACTPAFMTDANSLILSRYPKHRPELAPEYAAIYEQHLFSNRNGQYKTTSLSQRLEGWMHRKVASDITPGREISTLEIGAGTLNQLPYEAVVGPYDIVEPFHALYENAPGRERIRYTFNDISEVTSTGPYDRITNIAVFEHIPDLPVVVAHSALLLKPHGTLRVAIPNEGTPLWRLGIKVTGHEFRKRHGLSYEVLMRYEHVNTADDIEQVLGVFFKSLRCQVFGLCKSLGFYRFYECSQPDTGCAESFLKQRR